MTKKVSGFLAPDGKFFEDEWECDRYTHQQEIERLCDTHNINPENFVALLNSWHEAIRGYFDADSQCKQKQANGGEPDFDFQREPAIKPELPLSEEYKTNSKIRDPDAPGFLEQSFGVDK